MTVLVRTAGLILVIFGATVFPAAAQMAVTTYGATDASACYQNARNDFSQDTGPCDTALRDKDLTQKDRAKTLVNRGIIKNRKGDLQEAVDDFNAALAIDELGEAYLNRGNSYYLASRFDEALADYKKALALGVNKPWAAWYNIGLVHDAKKQADKAREAYQKALDLNPSFTLAQTKLNERE